MMINEPSHQFTLQDLINLKSSSSSIFGFIKSVGLYETFRNSRVMIGGGSILRALTGYVPNDIDVFFKDPRDIERVKRVIEEVYDAMTETGILKQILQQPPYYSTNAITYTIKNMPIQLILLPEMISSTATELINKFDYSICQVAYDFEFDDFVYTDNFFKDVSDHRIHYNVKCAHPISALLRKSKYEEREYYMPNMELVKLALSINSLNIKTYKDVAKELTGISTSYLKDLIEMLNSFEDKEFELSEMIVFLDEYINSKKILATLS